AAPVSRRVNAVALQAREKRHIAADHASGQGRHVLVARYAARAWNPALPSATQLIDAAAEPGLENGQDGLQAGVEVPADRDERDHFGRGQPCGWNLLPVLPLSVEGGQAQHAAALGRRM